MKEINWKKFVPIGDSLLGKKISSSRNWALLYLFLADMISKNIKKFNYNLISKKLMINNSQVYRMMEELVIFGYFKKIKTPRGIIYILTEDSFVKDYFVDRAYEFLDSNNK